MPKVIKIKNVEKDKTEIQNHFSANKDARFVRRLYVIALICNGHALNYLGDLFSINATKIKRLIHWLNEIDFQGLKDNPGRGRRSQLKDADRLQFKEDLIKSPKDLSLNRFLYDNMPSWLRELWMSGAQYYYDAIAPLPYVYKDVTPNYSYAQSWIKERSEDSLRAISKLLEYLKDMVPPVILNTPASLSDKDFLRD